MLLRDLTYAVRSLRRSPTFVVTAVLTLGLALGLTTTMFGILDAVVHPYVPVAALIACAAPTLRAARTDPSEILRAS